MNLALINIKQLVTVAANGQRVKTGLEMRNLGIIENAAVLINGDTITWVGRMEDLAISRVKETNVLDCHKNVVMPGFVDSHTHLVYSGSREEEFAVRCSGATYQEIASKGGGIISTVNHVRSSSKKELKNLARRWLDKMLRQGTTTVEIKSGYGLDARNEIKLLEAINELNNEEIITIVATFLGAHAVPPEYRENRIKYIDEVMNRMIPYVSSHKLATFCDVFCENGYFSINESQSILEQGKKYGMLSKIHADELTQNGGAELAARLKVVTADHLECVSDEGIKALASSDVIAVLLPGVSFFLNHRYAPGRRMIEAGVPVAIATDFNPGSCMCYSMPMMMTIACTQMHLTPEEVITASTLNAAAAVNLSDQLGSIEVGKKADIITPNIPNFKYLPYHFGENHVDKVIKNGVILEF